MLTPGVHRWIYLFGLCSLGFGMMMGTVPTSVPQIIIAANWLLEGGFAAKWARLRAIHALWWLGIFYGAHLVGMLYTEHLQAGWNDVRTKMPVFFLPFLVLTSAPLREREWRAVMQFFIAGSIVSTLWCLAYAYVLHPGTPLRSASRYMSHIRLGLYLDMAIAGCLWLAKGGGRHAWYYLAAAYFCFVLFAMGLASGITGLFLLSILWLGRVMVRRDWRMKLAAGSAFALVTIVSIFYVASVARQQLQVAAGPQNLAQPASALGNPYTHLSQNGQKENGNYVLINIQTSELQHSWNADFPGDTFSFSPPVNLSRFEVLVRYMASRGLNKDSLGYLRLSAADKKNVRAGITNFRFRDWSFLHRRTYDFVNDYDEFVHGRDVNGHSVSMRFYFWKAALHVIRRHWLVGVGTGDVQAELETAYQDTRSPLDPLWHKRPHNQLITIALALGLMGAAAFIVALAMPLYWGGRKLPWLYWQFFALLLASFVFEDTLETQAGATFYAFFNAFLLARVYVQKGTNSWGLTGEPLNQSSK